MPLVFATVCCAGVLRLYDSKHKVGVFCLLCLFIVTFQPGFCVIQPKCLRCVGHPSFATGHCALVWPLTVLIDEAPVCRTDRRSQRCFLSRCVKATLQILDDSEPRPGSSTPVTATLYVLPTHSFLESHSPSLNTGVRRSSE